MLIDPTADISFSVSMDLHDGQGIVLLRLPLTSSSNLFPHFLHLYSNIGMFLFLFLIVPILTRPLNPPQGDLKNKGQKDQMHFKVPLRGI
jgi:hypothetical protein